MRFARKPRRQPVINIISLIDILVVLLIFYIATTVFKTAQPKIKITVPKSENAKTAANDDVPVTLYVTADDKVFLDNQPVPIDKLGEILKSKVEANKNFKVALKADTKMTFGTLAKVMDAARFAGLGDLPTYMDKPGQANGAAAPGGNGP